MAQSPSKDENARTSHPYQVFVRRVTALTIVLGVLAFIPTLAALAGSLAVTVAGVVCSAACLARARIGTHTADKLVFPTSSAWLLTGLGTALHLGNQVSWVVYVHITGHIPQHVNGWVLATACSVVLIALGLVALISRQRSDFTRRTLDSLTIAGATGVVLWTVSSLNWIDIPLARAEAEAPEEAVPKLVLILSLSLMFAVVGAILAHPRHWRSAACVPALGWASAAISIFAIAATVRQNSPTGMGPFTLALCAGLLCTANTATRLRNTAPSSTDFGYGLQPFWPHAALIVSIAMTALQHHKMPDSDHVAVILLAFIGFIIVLRHHLTLNDNQQLLCRIQARELQLAAMAYRDDLTNLHNRRKFTTSLVSAINNPAYDPVAVIFIDLDGFKGVNDTFGHASGDQILTSLADRLRRAAPTASAIARIAGDEFAVLVPRNLDAEELAQKIVELGREPFMVGTKRADVTCSVGVAIWHREEEPVTAEQLLTRADQAMYDIKHRGRNNYRVFSDWMPDSPNAARALAPALAAAVATGEIRTHLQPVVNLQTGLVERYECLARWDHNGRPVPPDKFVGIAENAGLLDRLTDRIVSQACHAANMLTDHHDQTPIRIGVNIGAYSLRDPHFPERLFDTLSSYHLHPSQLYIEITETLPIEDMDQAGQVLSMMIQAGTTVSLDDFGTGYNSLTQLLRLSVNAVKIDRSLVTECDRDPDTRTVLTGLVDLAEHLEFEVIAEGVERLETAQVLAELGVSLAQGYYLGRPQPLEHWLATPTTAVITPLAVAANPLHTVRHAPTHDLTQPLLAPGVNSPVGPRHRSVSPAIDLDAHTTPPAIEDRPRTSRP